MDSPFFPLYIAGLMVIGLLTAVGVYFLRRAKAVRRTSDLPIIGFFAGPVIAIALGVVGGVDESSLRNMLFIGLFVGGCAGAALWLLNR